MKERAMQRRDENEEQIKAKFSPRRYDLDWLRVLVILAVFVFHSSRFFDLDYWHVKNATTYLGVQIWTTFLVNWLMPLIFVISGASTFYALGARGAGRFVKDRALRLLVPLVVGIFTHISVQVYLERVSHGQFSGSFFAFIPHYFDGMYAFGGNFAWMGLHLWYLEILFVFSLLLLPLFRWLKHGAREWGAAYLTRFLARPLVVYLLALPIMLLLSVLNPASILGNRGFGGWSLLIYILFFVYGFLLMGSDAVQQTIVRQRRLSLILGVALFLTLGGLWAGRDAAFGTPRFALLYSVLGLSSWCWILAILGFGMQHLRFNSPWLGYANEAVLPFYVLHQSVLIYLGYFVVRWPLPDGVKWLIIAPMSLAIIMALYEFLVRRSNVLRFLFGMKPLLKRVVQQVPSKPLRSTLS
jgi:peptidoglycan/LPS O-acetylase OafA/YrhL